MVGVLQLSRRSVIFKSVSAKLPYLTIVLGLREAADRGRHDWD